MAGFPSTGSSGGTSVVVVGAVVAGGSEVGAVVAGGSEVGAVGAVVAGGSEVGAVVAGGSEVVVVVSPGRVALRLTSATSCAG